MTREDIIAMAREAGFEQLGPDIEDWVCFSEEIERFAALVAAAAKAEEREACAKVCEELHPGLATRRAAEIIRARGETK